MAKIVVVGGSLGGLFVGNLLIKEGHDVIILEKVVGSLDGRGAGIVTHQNLIDALEASGISIDDNLGVHVTDRVTLDVHGQTISKIQIEQILTSWSRLYHLLKENFPENRYLQGKSVSNVSQNADLVTILCEDGSSYTADLVIASDGLRSAVRSLVAPLIVPEYAGYIAWRGVCDEYMLSKKTRDSLFNYFGFGLMDGEQILGYPVAGNNNDIRVGQRRYNFVWYRSAPEHTTLKDLLTDADGEYYPTGIPPVKVSWKHISDMRQRARAVLAPQWAEVVEKTALVFFQPIYDVVSNQTAFGRVALMGDAAFVARPHVGMGVTKAADDASSIVRHIKTLGANANALKAYEKERIELGKKVIDRTLYLGKYMQDFNHHQSADAIINTANRVMSETAVDISELLDKTPSIS
ncbi:MAG: FAD-dependent monooxygenase [Betaproteobacteria bacterium]